MNCDVCNATVTELRRGRCWGCYARWVDARPVGIGAHCCVCAERRRESLKTVELLGAWMPMCYLCSGRATALAPMPTTLAGIRIALRRERRDDERRGVKRDTRVFQYDRRGDDRRAGRTARGDEWLDIDDQMILEIAVEGSDRITAAPPVAPAADDEAAPARGPGPPPPPIAVAAMRPSPRLRVDLASDGELEADEANDLADLVADVTRAAEDDFGDDDGAVGGGLTQIRERISI